MNPHPPRHEIYVPGYVPQKLAMLIFGVVILAAGLFELTPRLALLLTGARADAQAVSVVKSKAGLDDLTFTDDVALERDMKIVDRSYLFWNVFRFQDAGGTSHEVRLPIAAVVKPIYTITDADGLPRMLPLVYSRSNPQHVIFPTVFSTWVFPALLTLIGMLTTGCAATILLYARKPIEMPILHDSTAETGGEPAPGR